MHSNNECLAIVMVDHVSNRFLKKLRIYHFSLSSSTFLTASWLPIFVSAEPSQTILLTAGLSMNILHTGDKSLVQSGFSKNGTGDLLPFTKVSRQAV